MVFIYFHFNFIVIPALKPVVEDLFLLRSMNKMDIGKELDAQREVVVSTLFKLVYYPQVLFKITQYFILKLYFRPSI